MFWLHEICELWQNNEQKLIRCTKILEKNSVYKLLREETQYLPQREEDFALEPTTWATITLNHRTMLPQTLEPNLKAVLWGFYSSKTKKVINPGCLKTHWCSYITEVGYSQVECPQMSSDSILSPLIGGA